MNDREKLQEARRAHQENDPPVEVNQIWECYDSNGSVMRSLRILALHPDLAIDSNRQWIYWDSTRRLITDRMGICPEFNLRFVFTLTDKKP